MKYGHSRQCVDMFCCLFPLLVHLSLFFTPIVATPYFRPWLEVRQTPTMGAPVGLIYPDNNDASTCPLNPKNLFLDASLIAGQKRKRRRNIHEEFKTPVSNPRGQHAKRALINGTCQTVARFGFEDWEASYGVNTPTITLDGGQTYTFSIAANVEISNVQCWTKKPNSGDFSRLGDTSPKNAKNVTLVTNIKSTTSVHWYIKFRYGHPRGNIAVFSNKPPALSPTGQWLTDTVTTSKLKAKKKRRRRKRTTTSWLWGS